VKDGPGGSVMETTLFGGISVWLDKTAPNEGAFAHALEWAARLKLPLHAVAAPWLQPSRRTRPQSLPITGAFLERGDPIQGSDWAGDSARVRACGMACAEKGVTWNISIYDQGFPCGVEHFLQPSRLCVFGETLVRPFKHELLYRSLQSPQTSVLICSGVWQPVSNVLILHRTRDPGSRFLDRVAEICLAFRVAPVVLTVAGSEEEARLRQRFAEETLAAHGLRGDFDFIAGCDVPTAVALGARHRRCSHVFVERQRVRPWWRWLRVDTMHRLLGLSDSLTFLTLSEMTNVAGPLGEARSCTAP
jgi:hypothetical protein